MASPTKTPPPPADEFYILKQGDIVGPFTEAELRAAVADGRLSGKDFAQSAGLPIWRPLARLLGLPDERGLGAVAPDWRSLMRWTWLRLRYHLDEDSVDAGVLCLLGGIVAIGLARWPVVFWLPWFVAAAVAGFALLRRRRAVIGVLLLGAVVAVPVLFAMLSSGKKAPAVASADAAAATSAPISRTTPAPLALESASTSLPPPPPGSKNAPVAEPSPTQGWASMLTEKFESYRRGEKPSPEEAEIAKAFNREIEQASAPAKPTTPVTALPPSATPPPPTTTPDAAPVPAVATPTAAPEPGIAQRAANFLTDLAKRTSPTLPTEPTPPTATPEPSPSKPITDGGELVQRHRDAFVVVQGKETTGSGFICRVGGKTWLYTNIHVVAGMREGKLQRLDGTQIKPGAAEAAAGRDVLRVALDEPTPDALDALDNIESTARIGDDIVVLGNSGGGGVVTSLPGKLTGLGPERVEISAEFIPGNSGSPIVHLATGRVIGIATYLTRRYEEFASGNPPSATPAPKQSPGPRAMPGPGATPAPGRGAVVTRRFGYRLDRITKWEPVNWAVLNAEAAQIEQISTLTGDIFDFLDALRSKEAPQFATETLRRPATEWLSAIRRQTISDADRLRATQSFLASLRQMVRADVATADARLRHTHFRERLSGERDVRDRLFQAFDEQAKRLASPSLAPAN